MKTTESSLSRLYRLATTTRDRDTAVRASARAEVLDLGIAHELETEAKSRTAKALEFMLYSVSRFSRSNGGGVAWWHADEVGDPEKVLVRADRDGDLYVPGVGWCDRRRASMHVARKLFESMVACNGWAQAVGLSLADRGRIDYLATGYVDDDVA